MTDYPARLPDAAQRAEQARLRHEANALHHLAALAEDRDERTAAADYRRHAGLCEDRVSEIYAEAMSNGPQVETYAERMRTLQFSRVFPR